MGNARMEALEDAYNALNKVKKSKEVKTVKKSDFHELKTNERTTREKKEGKEDKFMTLMRKNKNKKSLEKFHLTAIIKRTLTYTKDNGKIYKYDEENHKHLMPGHDKLTDSRVIEATSEQEAQQIFYEALSNDQTRVGAELPRPQTQSGLKAHSLSPASGPASVASRCAPRGSSSRRQRGGPTGRERSYAGAAQYPCAEHRGGIPRAAPSATPDVAARA